jgi:probable rRNA maturation factor
VNIVDVQSKQEIVELDEGLISQWAQQILKILGKDNIELSVVLTDNEQIRNLNRDYLGMDKPTNVISFSQQEGEGLAGSLLGDVVISVEKASEEATGSDIDLMGRIMQLLVHGICHLTGYNHEDVSREKSLEMVAAEERVLGRLKNPKLF